ncbi:hypothetical protein RvY_13816 [Ramazzottius varieornatus]|uniref:Uncharacterized protein n=1 Tax=Ramazzottius varieornatus TaxID=947166 RepID=A0A1D1VP83_RAMVA|nr:hypothetical protein RvY_13816 [Ramazzottius varieornatus]
MPFHTASSSQLQLLPKPTNQRGESTFTSGGEKAKEVKKRDSWKYGAEERLLQWMETPGNYDKYRSASQLKDDGRTRTRGKTKEAIKKEIEAMLAQCGFIKTTDQVHNKIDNLVSSWKKAHRALGGTGFESQDEKNLKGIRSSYEKSKVGKMD